MATYVYTARKDRGGMFTGEVSGDNKLAVAADLKRKGLTVLRLEEKRGAISFKGLVESSTKIKTRDKAVFARQFATMIQSGLAVLRALYVLEEQTQNPRFKKIIASVRSDVESGMSLSDAMERYPVAFDRLYVSMVRSGEIGGSLDQALNRLANQLEKDDSIRRTVKSAMAYPVMILSFAVLVMVGMLLFIIPIFSRMYADLGGELPVADPGHDGSQQYDEGLLVYPAARFGGSHLGLQALEEERQRPTRLGSHQVEVAHEVGAGHPEDRRLPLQPHDGYARELRCAHTAGDRDHR